MVLDELGHLHIEEGEKLRQDLDDGYLHHGEMEGLAGLDPDEAGALLQDDHLGGLVEPVFPLGRLPCPEPLVDRVILGRNWMGADDDADLVALFVKRTNWSMLGKGG